MRARLRPEVLLVAVVLGVLHQRGLLGDAPVWVPGLLLLPLVVGPARLQGWLATRRGDPSGRWLATFGAVTYIGLFAYAIGWGPVCVPGFAVALVADLELWGPGFTRRLLGVIAAAVVIGQVAVGLGWASSYLTDGESHAAAALGYLTVLFIGLTLERGAIQRDRIETSLENSGERFRLLAASSPIGIAELDRDSQMVYANERLWEVLGVPSGTDPVGFDYRARLTPEAIERLSLAATTGDMDGIDVPFTRDDEDRWMRVRIAPIGDRDGYVVSVADVTASVQVREALRREATHDDLTGLRNRGSFLSSLTAATLELPQGGPHALVFIDLDRFKQVNDAHGHAAGDALLVEAAKRIASVTRPDDVVGRLGGDEFGAVLWQADRDTAITVVEQILQELCRPYRVDEVDVQVGASAGVVLLEDGGLHSDALMRHADVAMYQAKSRSGGYEVVEPSRSRS